MEAIELKEFCEEHLIDLIEELGEKMVVKVEACSDKQDGIFFFYRILFFFPLSYYPHNYRMWEGLKDSMIPFIDILSSSYRFYPPTKTQKKNSRIESKYWDINIPTVKINDILFHVDDILNDNMYIKNVFDDTICIDHIEILIKNKIKRVRKMKNIKKFNEMWTQTTTNPKEDIDLEFTSKGKTYHGIHTINLSYNGKRTPVKAKFDTGARSSSIDFSVAKRLGISDALIERCKKLEDVNIPKNISKKEQTKLEEKYTEDLKRDFPEVTSVQGSKSSSGFSVRAYVRMNVEYHGKVIITDVNLRDRTGLSCEMLVGLKDML